MKLGFIGGGAMTDAIISGITAQKLVNTQDIYVSNHTEKRCTYLNEKYNVKSTVGAESFIEHVDVIILAIKPQVAQNAIDEIKNLIQPETVVISVIAGLMLDRLEENFPHNPVIRVMPNTPMAVGAGMSAIVRGRKASDSDTQTAQGIFAAGGETIIVEETLIDAVSGVSGSGPAFIFVIIDALSDAGVKAGLKREMAVKLAAQTVLGSAKMVLKTGLHPAQLRDQVTSPGGTTIEGIHIMEQRGVRGAMIDTITAAVEKSKIMRK